MDGITDGIFVDHDVLIDGAGYTIDAHQEGRMFNVVNSTLTLKNITLKNGYIYDCGGAIYAESSTINLENTVFLNNTALLGGAICCNGTDINCLNTVSFTNNSAYVGAAIAILSSNKLDTKNIIFTNNHAYYGVNVFSMGDVLIYLDSTIKNYNDVLKYYAINYNGNSSRNHDYDELFSNYAVTVIDANGLLNSFKSLTVGNYSFTENDFKEVMNGNAFGKTYYVNNYDELKYVVDRLQSVYDCIVSSELSKMLNNNVVNSNFVTAKIFLLPGNYSAKGEIVIGKKDQSMNISIYGNNQIIDCTNLNSYSLFNIVNGDLFLFDLTITNANNNVNRNLKSLITKNSFASLLIDNCNITNNVINSYKYKTTPLPNVGRQLPVTVVPNALINVNDVIIGSNVNFINNNVNSMINTDTFVINGANVSIINNNFESNLIKTNYTFINGFNIDFTNNGPRNNITYYNINEIIVEKKIFDYEHILCSDYLFIIANDFNFANNKAPQFSCIYTYNYAMISGNRMNFVNNEGTLFVKSNGVDNTILNNYIANSNDSLGAYVFSKLYNKYNFTNTNNAFKILGKNMNFSNNYGKECSILKVTSGDVYLNNLTFENNIGQKGGVILIDTTSNVGNNNIRIITNNLTFINNQAKYGSGGAINIIGKNTIYTNNKICNNVSIFANELSFINNTAKGGGAIYAQYSNVKIITRNNMTMVNNSALRGGAISSLKSNVTIISGYYSIFEDNVAQYYGSALFLEDSILNITGGYGFINNTQYMEDKEGYSSMEKTLAYNYYINHNSILYLNNETCTSTDFLIYNNIIDNYCYKDVNNVIVKYDNDVMNTLNNYTENKTLHELGFSSINELNENTTDLFISKSINNTNSLFDSNNYLSYTLTQYIYLADGTLTKRTTHYHNIYSYDDLKSYMSNQCDCDVLVLNLFANNNCPYIFEEKFKLIFDVNTVHINGNGVTFSTTGRIDSSKYRALYLMDNKQHVYVNNLTFNNFNEPITNHGYLYLDNCSFTNNRIYNLLIEDYAGVIDNHGFLKCENCTFENNFGQYSGVIYNEPGTYCSVINCTFKDNIAYQGKNHECDIYNYNKGNKVNLTTVNSTCTIKNKEGAPSWVRYVIIGVTAIAATALIVYTGGAASSAIIGKLTATNAMRHVASTALLYGTNMLVCGAIGTVVGFVVGSIDAVIIGGIYRESISKLWVKYATIGAAAGLVVGLMTGALSTYHYRFSNAHYLEPGETRTWNQIDNAGWQDQQHMMNEDLINEAFDNFENYQIGGAFNPRGM